MTLILPLLIPLVTATALLAVRSRLRVQAVLAVGGALAHLLSALFLLSVVWEKGILTVQMGGWPAPFGITLVGDLLASIMVVLGSITGVGILVYSTSCMDRQRLVAGYYPVVHLLLLGVTGAFLTGDLFNLYVWFEVLLISSFVLMALEGDSFQLEGTFKYVVLNLFASFFFLTGIGLLYSLAGTLNMADLALRLSATDPHLVTIMASVFLLAFGIKSGVFPLFFWLPASYHTPPIPVAALFAGLLTKVGVYALIRTFTLIFPGTSGYLITLILVIAALTMVTGVLGAAAQEDVRRILSFHIISQIGYMVLGLGLLSPLALAGSVFYLIHHIIVKANLFLVGGLIDRVNGSFQLDRLGGLYRSRPGLAVLFLIPALSLAGIPPLSGFWAKFVLVRAGFEAGDFWVAGVALVVGLLTLFSMTKIWVGAFWKPLPTTADSSHGRERLPFGMMFPVAVLAALTISIGLGADLVFQLSTRTAEQLTNPQEYIRVVLEAR